MQAELSGSSVFWSRETKAKLQPVFNQEMNRDSFLCLHLRLNQNLVWTASVCRIILFSPQAVLSTLCTGGRNVPGRQEVTFGVRGASSGARVAKQGALKLQPQQTETCSDTSHSPVMSQELPKKMWLEESWFANTAIGNKGKKQSTKKKNRKTGRLVNKCNWVRNWATMSKSVVELHHDRESETHGVLKPWSGCGPAGGGVEVCVLPTAVACRYEGWGGRWLGLPPRPWGTVALCWSLWVPACCPNCWPATEGASVKSDSHWISEFVPLWDTANQSGPGFQNGV